MEIPAKEEIRAEIRNNLQLLSTVIELINQEPSKSSSYLQAAKNHINTVKSLINDL